MYDEAGASRPPASPAQNPFLRSEMGCPGSGALAVSRSPSLRLSAQFLTFLLPRHFLPVSTSLPLRGQCPEAGPWCVPLGLLAGTTASHHRSVRSAHSSDSLTRASPWGPSASSRLPASSSLASLDTSSGPLCSAIPLFPSLHTCILGANPSHHII